MKSIVLRYLVKLFDLSIYVEGIERVVSVFNSKIIYIGLLFCVMKEIGF